MSLMAAYYMHSTDLMCKRTKIKIAKEVNVKMLDLCRPDVFIIYDVDAMIAIWMWLKGEIKRLAEYSSRCDYFYRHCKETCIGSKTNYIGYLHENMSRIFLGFRSEMGRDKFDKKYPLKKTATIPLRYYKSHAPLEWGEKQLDLINEITHLEKPIRLTWSPNSCHKKANVVYHLGFYFDHEKFHWQAAYDYNKDFCSSWTIDIQPKPNQMILDFMLNVRKWLKRGMKRKDLKKMGDEYSNIYEIDIKSEDKKLLKDNNEVS